VAPQDDETGASDPTESACPRGSLGNPSGMSQRCLGNSFGGGETRFRIGGEGDGSWIPAIDERERVTARRGKPSGRGLLNAPDAAVRKWEAAGGRPRNGPSHDLRREVIGIGVNDEWSPKIGS
jgi:hypothetical protein